MMDIFGQPGSDLFFFVLQINLIWMAGFGAIYGLTRRQDTMLQYRALLAWHLLLPLALLISLLIINNRTVLPDGSPLTYNVFVSAAAAGYFPPAPPKVQHTISLLPLAAGVLILLAMLRFLHHFRSLFRFAGAEDYRLNEQLAEVRAMLGMRQKVRIVLAHWFNAPFSFGWRRPLIVMPESLAKMLTLPQLRMIIYHELVHIRRQDFLLNLAQKLVRVLFFYNPLIHVSDRLIEEKREMLCDAEVLKYPGNGKKSYAATLLRVTEIAQRGGRLSPVIFFYSQPSQLKRRILVMNRPQPSYRSYRITSALLLIILSGFLAMACSALQAAGPEKDDKRIYQSDGIKVTLDAKQVEVRENGQRKVYEKGSREYALWERKFSLLEQTEQELQYVEQNMLEMEDKLRAAHERLQLQREEYLQQQQKNRTLQREELMALRETEMARQEERMRQVKKELQAQHETEVKRQNELMKQYQEMLQAREKEIVRERDRIADEHARIEEELRQVEQEQQRLVEGVRGALIEDGFLKKGAEKFDFKYEDGKVHLNGKLLKDADAAKYRRIIEKISGEPLDNDFRIQIVE